MSTSLSNSEILEILLEAARRANWDALHGPEHLRSGRYDPNTVLEFEEAAQHRWLLYEIAKKVTTRQPRDDVAGRDNADG